MRSSAQSKGPDFVCIGAQKAGTTWLYDNLSVQKGVWLPPIKELHFFNTVAPNEELIGVEERRWTGLRDRWGPLLERPSPATLRWLRRFHNEPRTTAWYRSLFPAELVGHRVAGDITPAYSTLDERGVAFARRVLRPRCRVLLLIRHPVDRVWSALKMKYRWRTASLDDADLDRLLREMDDPGHRLRTDYPRMIRLWGDAFGEDFRVDLYDRLTADPAGFLSDVMGFVGTAGEPDRSRLDRRSNRDPDRKSIPAVLEMRLLERFGPQLEELAALVPEVDRSWRREPSSSS